MIKYINNKIKKSKQNNFISDKINLVKINQNKKKI